MIYINERDVRLRDRIRRDEKDNEILIILERYGFDPLFCPICSTRDNRMIFVSWDDLIAHIKAIHGQDVRRREEKEREIERIWNWEDIW